MAEEKSKENESQAESKKKGAGSGFMVGAILGVVLSVAMGFITVGLLLPPGNKGAKNQDEEARKSQKTKVKLDIPEITWNVPGTKLKVVGQAKCKLEYETSNPEEAGKLVQEHMDMLNSEIFYFLSSKSIDELDGGENKRRLAKEAMKIAQRVLFEKKGRKGGKGKKQEPIGRVTNFWFMKLLAQ